jgi:hypothetical protein
MTFRMLSMPWLAQIYRSESMPAGVTICCNSPTAVFNDTPRKNAVELACRASNAVNGKGDEDAGS